VNCNFSIDAAVFSVVIFNPMFTSPKKFRVAPIIYLAGHLVFQVHAGELPRVFSADTQTLAASKSALAAGDITLQPALNQLLKDANARLNQTPPSVMDKKGAPPSGDKHDYLSQAPYYWRDTNSPNGKYIRRDGERNPESNADSDAGRLNKVCTSVYTLGLAYYFSGDEKYAKKATELMRVFFLDPATRMNPNLNFGQGIPGEVDGRPAGLISARCLADLVDGIGLLAGSKLWTTDDQAKMASWAKGYFHWLTTSKIGLGENAASNNHGTFYDVQAVSLALFIGETNFAREKLLAARTKRIANEIEPDGKMPRELARTLSFNYSLFNLRAEIELADLGRVAGVDLWHYETKDGRSIVKAAEFLAPFANPERKWTHQQIHQENREELESLLRRVAVEFPENKSINDALKFFKPDTSDPERLYLRLG
jgi:hypothetical protein